ncbi:MAG: amidohydrolase family protein [Acidimicrobiia bacterium]
MPSWRRQLDQLPDRPPVLPLVPGPLSNGEFVPHPPSPADRLAAASVLRRVERAAHRTGIDRRRFLQSSAGVAASLLVFNACSGDGADPGAGRPGAGTTTGPGGRFEVPEPEDVAACDRALAGDELVFDVHTHHVVPDGPWRERAPRIASMIEGLVPPGCAEGDPFRCLDRTAYLHDLFVASDTTLALLSDVPNSGPEDAPVPWEAKRETRRLAEALAVPGASRVLLHDVIAPNFGDLGLRLDEMARSAETGEVTAFKVYTAWGPQRRGFALDDPVVGIPVVEQARRLGVKTICAHKGLPLLEFDRSNNGPRDLVALSRLYPDMDFVVYHGAYERETTERAFAPGAGRAGVDSLVQALADHGVGPNENVWAELGTTWREVLSNPTEAAHAVGKLLLHVGADRVLWGTDAIWYGSPQPQIMAFRAFQISPELQERHGYPALTDEVKRKVFGLNAAALFGVDVEATRCALDEGGLGAARAQHAALVTEGAIPEPWRPRGPVTRREVLAWVGGGGGHWSA